MVTESDFAFAFNEAKFSDRLLRIEINGDWVRDRKRRRQDGTNGCEDDEKVTTRIKELHISSPILAAKSPFFLKLFSNGMLESEQRYVTLNIDASEEAAVMELLNFMYSNKLSVTTARALLDVLMVADKYEVVSCMKYCSDLLLYIPMTVESALLLLDLPSSVVAADTVEPLTNSARKFLASHYKDIFKFPLEEIMALPLIGIQAILASDDLEIESEDKLYDLVLKWLNTHYSDQQERQEILTSRLSRYIRFPQMKVQKLVEIATSDDLKPSIASKIILGALKVKEKPLHYQRRLAGLTGFPWVAERAYKYRPIQIVEFEIPRHQCIVYLDLTLKDCAGLYPSGWLSSQSFSLGGHRFVLCARCKMDQPSSFHCFGLFLHLQGSVSLNVDYEFAARSKPAESFVVQRKGNDNFAGNMTFGINNLFSRPWESFMAKDCPYFINDILHLRVELSIPNRTSHI